MSSRSVILAGAAALLALSHATPSQAAINVLWWDTTPYSQDNNSVPWLNAFGGGTVFNATRVNGSAGTFATHMSSNSYDVIVFDATGGGSPTSFNAADQMALRTFYTGNRNILLDGTLYIRDFTYNSTTTFPGPNGATGGLTANQIHQLATRGGGFMIGTDHNCCQADGNFLLSGLFPGVAPAFSGITYPSADGVWYGADMLNSIVPVAPVDVFTHWDSVPSEAITPTGTFTDFLGNQVTFHSQVDVADDPGGGQRYPYISTSWAPGSGTTGVDDEEPPPPTGEVPLPPAILLLAAGVAGLRIAARRA